jgi:hypothetical protein
MEDNDIEKKKGRIKKSTSSQVSDYSDIYAEYSCLDGWFTSDELRIIANAMDELKKLEIIDKL